MRQAGFTSPGLFYFGEPMATSSKNKAPKTALVAKTPERPGEKSEKRVVQVRATRLGYYGHMLRPVGTVFNIRLGEGEKFPSWCEELKDGAAKADESKEEESTPRKEQKGSSSDEVI